MTTATRRLRRSGVAGFAAAVTAGATLLATATSAFALTATFQRDTATAATTIFAGDAAAAVASTQISVPNTAVAIGNTIVLKIEGTSVVPTVSNQGVGFTAAPTVAVTGPFTAPFGAVAGSSTDVTPTFNLALGSSAGAATAAGIKDELTITFTSSSSGVVGDSYTFEVSGATVKVGSAVLPGTVQEHPYVSDGGASLAAAVTVANVANTKAVEATTTVPSSVSAQTGIGLATLTLSDVGSANIITSPITLTTSATAFTAAVLPTVTGPTGSTWTVTHPTTTTLVLTAAGTAFPTTANTFTITGLQVDVPALTGTYTVTATDAAGTIGSAQTALVVTTQGRVGGIDRYATSAQLYTGQFPLATNIVLASGQNFPDALSATYLAKRLNTGVLLTDPNVLQQATSLVLTNNVITTVYIVGGTAAVSANVQNAISALHVGNNPGNNALLTVVRVAGADRYATNNAVDLYNGASAGTTAVVATGQNFADALAVGPAVYNKAFPLVLTGTGSLDANAQSTLVNLGIHTVIIVGGTSAISAAVETAIKAIPGVSIGYRIAGADRTLTASQIATWETQTLPATTAYAALGSLGFPFTTTSVADLGRGDGFADALSAGAVAGSQARVILLTADPNNLGAGAPAYLSAAGLAHVSGLVALGLTGAVSVATFNAALAAL